QWAAHDSSSATWPANLSDQPPSTAFYHPRPGNSNRLTCLCVPSQGLSLPPGLRQFSIFEDREPLLALLLRLRLGPGLHETRGRPERGPDVLGGVLHPCLARREDVPGQDAGAPQAPGRHAAGVATPVLLQQGRQRRNYLVAERGEFSLRKAVRGRR